MQQSAETQLEITYLQLSNKLPRFSALLTMLNVLVPRVAVTRHSCSPRNRLVTPQLALYDLDLKQRRPLRNEHSLPRVST